MKRVALAALLVPFLVACDGGRECVRSHTEMVYVPKVTTPGQFGIPAGSGWHFVPRTFCDEYAPEPAK